jgi:hypothetical protein
MATIAVHFVGGSVVTIEDDASVEQASESASASVASSGALSGPTPDGSHVVIPLDNVTFIEVSASGPGPALG